MKENIPLQQKGLYCNHATSCTTGKVKMGRSYLQWSKRSTRSPLQKTAVTICTVHLYCPWGPLILFIKKPIPGTGLFKIHFDHSSTFLQASILIQAQTSCGKKWGYFSSWICLSFHLIDHLSSRNCGTWLHSKILEKMLILKKNNTESNILYW